MKEIVEMFEKITHLESRYFVLNINQETGEPTAFITDRNDRANYGALEVLDYARASSHKDPYSLFTKFDTAFRETKEKITNDILGFKASIEAQINADNYRLFSSVINNLAYASSTLAVWVEPEEEQTYILINYISEEEIDEGILAALFLCRIEP